MRRLLRLFAVTAGAAVLLTGTIVAFAVIGGNALHHVASAQELPLPPIDSKLQEPSTVYADDGTTVLATLSGPEFRQPIGLAQVSTTMVSAVLDTEDHGFYLHGGFDIPSIVRAFVDDAQGQGLQGGSTIPQQLVKQLYLTSVRTVNRKVREAVLADRLEQQYSRDQILQAYLNTIYLGSGAYGVQAAAKTYFRGGRPDQLNLAQASLLAGMIQDPNGYDPILQPSAARERRSEVLQRMVVVRRYHRGAADSGGQCHPATHPDRHRRHADRGRSGSGRRLLRQSGQGLPARRQQRARDHLRRAGRRPVRGRPQDRDQPGPGAAGGGRAGRG